jgi:sortase A
MTVLASQHAAERTRRPTGRTVVRVLGELMITIGVVILLFVAYELWWTGFYTGRAQTHLLSQLRHAWQSPASAGPQSDARAHRTITSSVAQPANGTGIAVLRIPRLGDDYVFAIVEGTDTADLKKGPGHYSGTAMPGQVGDFAVAGHRTTYLHPFYDLNELHHGDPIVVETAKRWFTYRVTSTKVPPGELEHRLDQAGSDGHADLPPERADGVRHGAGPGAAAGQPATYEGARPGLRLTVHRGGSASSREPSYVELDDDAVRDLDIGRRPGGDRGGLDVDAFDQHIRDDGGRLTGCLLHPPVPRHLRLSEGSGLFDAVHPLATR